MAFAGYSEVTLVWYKLTWRFANCISTWYFCNSRLDVETCRWLTTNVERIVVGSLSYSLSHTYYPSPAVCVFLLTSNCESLITAWSAMAVVQINLEIFQLVGRVFVIQALSKRCTANQFVAADRSRHMKLVCNSQNTTPQRLLRTIRTRSATTSDEVNPRTCCCWLNSIFSKMSALFFAQVTFVF